VTDEVVTEGVVENLVTQFSNALDCFRELVQNSIDSGSARVEVWSELHTHPHADPSDGDHLGAMAFHVDDWGEGMDQAIIDTQLTRLFSSSKEGDLTKIGKFGIGFVSVFALEPRAVLVHTGRGGEYWEVLFDRDRSFTTRRLDVPVEGTQVTLFKEGDAHAYRELVEGVRQTLVRWCAHAETEVTFEDRSPPGGAAPGAETINRPFAVEGDCLTRVEAPGTLIVLAYDAAPIYGFYNRGLTLALTSIGDQVLDGERARRYRRIAFKISSRYLEHTLSRETVMRDESYEKAIALLDQAADGPLFERLLAELRDLVGLPDWGLAEMSRYVALWTHLAWEPVERLRGVAGEPILRGTLGAARTPNDVFDAASRDGRVLLSPLPSDLVREIEALGTPVLLGRARADRGNAEAGDDEARHPLDAVAGVVQHLLVAWRARSVAHRVSHLLEVLPVLREYEIYRFDPRAGVAEMIASPEQVFVHVDLDAALPPDAAPLLERAQALLRSIGAGYGALATFLPSAASGDDLAPSAPPLFVTAPRICRVMARSGPGDQGPTGRRLEAAVCRSHPHFQALLRLHVRSPALAAYCLARALLLNDDRHLDRGAAMMRAALGAPRTARDEVPGRSTTP
jgi:hypothetical protein